MPGIKRIGTIAAGMLLPMAAAPALGQAGDAGFARAVREWTTAPAYLSPLVDHLPAGGRVPAPIDYFGDHIGKPGKLHYTREIRGYFDALAKASPRVRIVDLGTTEEGGRNFVAFISSEGNLGRLEQNRAALARLADARTTTPSQAAALIAGAVPLVHLTGGLHSSEASAPEALSELAFRLVADDGPAMQRIRDKVIVAISPVIEPDGRDRFVDWYYASKISGNDDRVDTPPSPYWGKYMYHDNNRDVVATGMLTKNYLKFFLEWRPVWHEDFHESFPYIYLYSGRSEYDPGVDPVTLGEMSVLSSFQKAGFYRFGMPGAWDHGDLDIWWPGYFNFIGSYHNALSTVSEVQGVDGATTSRIHADALSPGERDFTARTWFRPVPARASTMWSIRNSINYVETAALLALDLAARTPDTLLENFHAKARDAIATGARGEVKAFVIPAGQPDQQRVAEVVNFLRTEGIEVHRARAPFTLAEGTFAAGSFIVRLDQPYAPLARTLLSRQVYRPGGVLPFVDSAWSVGLMVNTGIVPVKDAEISAVPGDPVDRYAPQGDVAPAGARFYAVVDDGAWGMATLRSAATGYGLRRLLRPVSAVGVALPAGSVVFGGRDYARIAPIARAAALRVVALPSDAGLSLVADRLPRIAVYSTWGSTQNVGWIRYALDRLGVRYDLIFKDDARAGGLRAKYDVMLIPDQGDGKQIVEDVAGGRFPAPYVKTARFRSLGDFGAAANTTGGLGEQGVAALRDFVAAGGRMVTLGRASSLPIDYGIVQGLTLRPLPRQIVARRPIVTARIAQPGDPVMEGYAGETLPVLWSTSSLLEVAPGAQAQVLLRFVGGADGVQSGMMQGAEGIAGAPAIVRVAAGKGEVILFQTSPALRWQNIGELRMLTNAIMNPR